MIFHFWNTEILQKHGSLSRLLIDHVLKNNSTARIVSRDQKTFTIIKLNKKNTCGANSAGLISYENRSEWGGEKFARQELLNSNQSRKI